MWDGWALMWDRGALMQDGCEIVASNCIEWEIGDSQCRMGCIDRDLYRLASV